MLTPIQAEAARAMAGNRTQQSYFAGGAVLNRNNSRQSDDLDIFTDDDEIIPEIVSRDIASLEAAGFAVEVTLQIYGCTDAVARKHGFATQIQWMSETRFRYFPLQPDPQWGLRLHDADLQVNKVLAASTRRKARDVLDLALILESGRPLGPLLLGASVKLGALSPPALLDQARHRAVSMPRRDIECLRGLPKGWNVETVKGIVLAGLDAAEDFLRDVPAAMIGGLPVDAAEAPADRVERMAQLRPLVDGGGPFPSFPDESPGLA